MAIVVNLPYSQQLTVVGGTAPYALTLKSGSLPPGLTLDITGLLSGTPTALGTFGFTVQAVDGFLGYGERLYSLEVIDGTNEFGDDLIAEGATHYWPLDELSGSTLADAVGSLDLETNGPAGTVTNYPHGLPGLVVRGTPRSFGICKNERNSSPFAAAQAGPARAGWTTGGVGCCFIILDDAQSGDLSLMSVTHINNSGLIVNLQVLTTLALRFEILGSGRNISKQTSAGAIVPNTPYVAYCEQRADGTGLHLFINGVENTDNATGFGGSGVDIDSFADQVITGFAESQTTIGGINTGAANSAFDASGAYIVSEPHIFRNVVRGDAAIAAQHAEAKIGVLPSTDFYETIFDLGRKNAVDDAVHLGPNFTGANGDLGYGLAPLGSDTENALPSSFDADDENILDTVVGLRVESAYATRKWRYDISDNPTFFQVASPNNYAGNETAGTWCAIVTIRGCGDGDRKIISTYGISQSRSIELGIVGSVIGYQIFFRAFENPTETFRVLSGIIGLGATPVFHMLSVVQPGDGSGAILYLDDQLMSNAPAISTNPDVWVADFGATTYRWGGEQGSATIDNWEPGDLHKNLQFRYALSAAEIARVWGAVKGTSF